MYWFLYDNGLRHERVNIAIVEPLLTTRIKENRLKLMEYLGAFPVDI